METTIFQIMMNVNMIIFHTTDWSTLPVIKQQGETGTAKWQTMHYGTLRIRVVKYSENYKANHWCNLGHILYCLEGEMTTELKDGRVIKLTKGMSYQVTDGASAHRTRSEQGVKVLIIDGGFLKQQNDHNPWKM